MDSYNLTFSRSEIDDLLENLQQCASEGYLNYGDPAYIAMEKLECILNETQLSDLNTSSWLLPIQPPRKNPNSAFP